MFFYIDFCNSLSDLFHPIVWMALVLKGKTALAVSRSNLQVKRQLKIFTALFKFSILNIEVSWRHDLFRIFIEVKIASWQYTKIAFPYFYWIQSFLKLTYLFRIFHDFLFRLDLIFMKRIRNFKIITNVKNAW